MSPLARILARDFPRDPAALAGLRDFAQARMRMYHRLSHEWEGPPSCWAYTRAVEWAGRVVEIQREMVFRPQAEAGASTNLPN